jgi:hypothetical protein
LEGRVLGMGEKKNKSSSLWESKKKKKSHQPLCEQPNTAGTAVVSFFHTWHIWNILLAP